MGRELPSMSPRHYQNSTREMPLTNRIYSIRKAYKNHKNSILKAPRAQICPNISKPPKKKTDLFLLFLFLLFRSQNSRTTVAHMRISLLGYFWSWPKNPRSIWKRPTNFISYIVLIILKTNAMLEAGNSALTSPHMFRTIHNFPVCRREMLIPIIIHRLHILSLDLQI